MGGRKKTALRLLKAICAQKVRQFKNYKSNQKQTNGCKPKWHLVYQPNISDNSISSPHSVSVHLFMFSHDKSSLSPHQMQ